MKLAEKREKNIFFVRIGQLSFKLKVGQNGTYIPVVPSLLSLMENEGSNPSSDVKRRIRPR